MDSCLDAAKHKRGMICGYKKIISPQRRGDSYKTFKISLAEKNAKSSKKSFIFGFVNFANFCELCGRKIFSLRLRASVVNHMFVIVARYLDQGS